MRAWALILGLVGCHHKAAAVAELAPGPAETAAQTAVRPEVNGPVRWWDRSGLCLEVPAGWRGWGRGDRGALLTLDDERTGARVEILQGDAPADRRDLVRVFDDPGRWRDIPALPADGVETWVSDVPGGPTLHVWHASVRGAPIRVEARYPFGRVFTGYTHVRELLQAVCVE